MQNRFQNWISLKIIQRKQGQGFINSFNVTMYLF
jgi:hypothetical protein